MTMYDGDISTMAGELWKAGGYRQDYAEIRYSLSLLNPIPTFEDSVFYPSTSRKARYSNFGIMNVTFQCNVTSTYPIIAYANVDVQNGRILRVINTWLEVNNPPLPYHYSLELIKATPKIVSGKLKVDYDFYISSYMSIGVSILSIDIPICKKARTNYTVYFSIGSSIYEMPRG